MLIIDIGLLIPFAITLFFWTRGTWKRSAGDRVLSAITLAVSVAAYAYFYPYTSLVGVPWVFAIVCAVAGTGVLLREGAAAGRGKRLGACLMIPLCLSAVFFLAERKWNSTANSILLIAPYRSAGTWVFDEPRLGLHAEPFVAGIPELIDELVAEAGITNADKGFCLLFSAQPFPDSQTKITWRRQEAGGNWYHSEKYAREGWLCPALFKYFKRAPGEIYVKATPR